MLENDLNIIPLYTIWFYKKNYNYVHTCSKVFHTKQQNIDLQNTT